MITGKFNKDISITNIDATFYVRELALYYRIKILSSVMYF